MRMLVIGAAALLASCVSASSQDTTADTTLAAIRNTHVRECPAGRTQANARREGFGPQSGVVGEDIALTPLASDPTRAVRLRRLTVQAGGVIAWHDHAAVQGMALIASGQATERRNSCLDDMIYRAGDVALEDASTAHSWRNDGDEPAVFLVAHVIARPQ
jgi:quercetin dioxygenase-like cupin family protein